MTSTLTLNPLLLLLLLPRLADLRDLKLFAQSSNLSTAGLNALASLPHLTRLELTPTKDTDLFWLPHLAGLTQLRQLDLLLLEAWPHHEEVLSNMDMVRDKLWKVRAHARWGFRGVG